jgi:hypothetical protein
MDIDINKGETWASPEYVLTPHNNGWAKGIEVYREWFNKNYKRDYPLPDHIKKGLGFRTIWMSQNQPNDKQDVYWKIKDIPEVAVESKQHGLDELVLWAWHQGFELPLPQPYPHLGTEQDLVEAVKKSKQIGVNVAPFISVLQADKVTAHKYGLTVPDTGGWTYHPESIPRFQPLYAHGYRCAQIDTANKLWHEEVVSSCKRMADLGIPSVSWDQFWAVKQEPNMQTLTQQIREYAKKTDPQSTFSGEELWNMEIDCQYLDYTWNWNRNEYKALMSVLPAPRVNMNIGGDNVDLAKFCFADNVYLNVFPAKPGSINGSAGIKDYPELSRGLKQCAKLRAQFISYFVDGTFISDCVLIKPCIDAHVSAYVLQPGKLLIIVINKQRLPAKKVRFNCDFSAWLDHTKGRKYLIKSYNGSGKLVHTKKVSSPVWFGTTASLKYLDMTLFEIETF